MLANDNRKHFQAKKHVSLDVTKFQASKVYEDLLKGSSSSEETFEDQRKEFQARKHKSLDARHISFKLEKEPTPSTSSEEEEYGFDQKRLLHIDPDITKPVIIDFKVQSRKNSSITDATIKYFLIETGFGIE